MNTIYLFIYFITSRLDSPRLSHLLCACLGNKLLTD